MIGFYSYTVVLTYVGLFSAVTGMVLALNGNTNMAIFCLMFSGLCDMFDGQVASTKKDRTEDEKKFGVQIDSLCDIVCFGVLPAIIGYSLKITSPVGYSCMAFFVLGGVIRLAFFNVLAEKKTESADDKPTYYRGLPITSSALIFPAIMFLNKILVFGDALPLIYEVTLLVCAFLFVIDIRILKPKKVGKFLLLLVGIVLFVLYFEFIF